MSSVDEIAAQYGGLQANQEAFYKDRHQHPELSHQEERTAGRVAERLQKCDFTVQSGIGGTGVVGILSNGAALACFLIRAAGIRYNLNAPVAPEAKNKK